jgi:hypothetical protein
MRTTIDIPEHLLREAKAAAAIRGIKFKELVGQFFEQGIKDLEPVPTISRPRVTPIIPATNRVPYSLSNAEIEEIFALEDAKLDKNDRPA